MASPSFGSELIVRQMVESDLADADRIIRLAFATFLGLPPDDPRRPSDSDHARTRWHADPSATLAAEHSGKLIGSNFATNWGSFSFFGPLTVTPDYWNRGVAQQLLAPTMEIFGHWGSRHLGLYTFAQSPKHLALYQKFGFWPRDLVAVMARQLNGSAQGGPIGSERADRAIRFSQAAPSDRSYLLAACREVTDANFAGLDLEREIRAISDQKLGDTLLVWGLARLDAFAVCHSGPNTEAGSGVCYVKFAAVRPTVRAAESFARLLDAIDAFAHSVNAPKITAGVNLARREAFLAMLARGFRTEMQGVAMETGSAASGYNRAGVYILDDWR